MQRKLLVIAIMLVFVLPSCNSNQSNKIITEQYNIKDSGIEFNYPTQWIVTDKSMGPGVNWLVVSQTEFKVVEGNKLPFVQIIKLEPSDLKFIENRLDNLKEANKNKELKSKKIKINQNEFIKYETDKIEEEGIEAKGVIYVYNDENKTLLIQTVDHSSYKNEVSTIINSIIF